MMLYMNMNKESKTCLGTTIVMSDTNLVFDTTAVIPRHVLYFTIHIILCINDLLCVTCLVSKQLSQEHLRVSVYKASGASMCKGIC